MAALQPAVTAGVAAFSAPHPARLHTSARRLLTPAARRQLAFYQVPTLPERALVRGDLVADVLATGAAQPFAPDVVDTYRTVMRIPFAAHTAMESLRWAVRSTPRPDGRRFLAALRHPVEVPASRCTRRRTACCAATSRTPTARRSPGTSASRSWTTPGTSSRGGTGHRDGAAPGLAPTTQRPAG